MFPHFFPILPNFSSFFPRKRDFWIITWGLPWLQNYVRTGFIIAPAAIHGEWSLAAQDLRHSRNLRCFPSIYPYLKAWLLLLIIYIMVIHVYLIVHVYIYIICNIIYIHIQKRTYQLSFPPLEAICYFGIVFEDSHFLVVSLFQFRPAMKKSQMAVLPARRSVNLWLRGSQILSPVALEKERGFEAFEAYSDLASLWKEWGSPLSDRAQYFKRWLKAISTDPTAEKACASEM